MSRRSGFLVAAVSAGVLAFVGCGSDHCPGGSVSEPGAPRSPAESRAEVSTWEVTSADADPSVAGLLQFSTPAYRFDGDVVVVGAGTVVPLVGDFVIDACGPGGEDLMDARFGATFYVDPQTGEAVRAGCNGC